MKNPPLDLYPRTNMPAIRKTRKKTQKKCRTCGLNRRINQRDPTKDGFHKKRASKDGYQPDCKLCRRPVEAARRKVYYKKNRKREIEGATFRYLRRVEREEREENEE